MRRRGKKRTKSLVWKKQKSIFSILYSDLELHWEHTQQSIFMLFPEVQFSLLISPLCLESQDPRSIWSRATASLGSSAIPGPPKTPKVPFIHLFISHKGRRLLPDAGKSPNPSSGSPSWKSPVCSEGIAPCTGLAENPAIQTSPCCQSFGSNRGNPWPLLTEALQRDAWIKTRNAFKRLQSLAFWWWPLPQFCDGFMCLLPSSR